MIVFLVIGIIWLGLAVVGVFYYTAVTIKDGFGDMWQPWLMKMVLAAIWGALGWYMISVALD